MTRTSRTIRRLLAWGVLLTPALALAQTPPPVAPAPAPPVTQTPPPVAPPVAQTPPPVAPPVAQAPAPAPPVAQTPPPVAQAQPQCVPMCRQGYICHQGQCISACNPPCPAGQACTSAGECVAVPAPAPAPGPPPPPPLYPQANQPPPVAPAPGEAWDPYRSRRKWIRPFLNLDLLADGAGTYSNIDTDEDSNYDLGVSVGLHGGVAFRIARFFAIGASIRWFTSQVADVPPDTDRFVHFDIGPSAIFRVNVGQRVEIQFPLSIAYSIQIPPYNAPTSTGFALGFHPGVLVWVAEHFGLQANLGYDAHILSGQEDASFGNADFVDAFYNLRLSFGVSLGF